MPNFRKPPLGGPSFDAVGGWGLCHRENRSQNLSDELGSGHRPAPVKERGAEIDNQVAAPAEMSTPNWHPAKIAQEECGWKDGDRGGSAQMQRPPTGKEKNRLDSHGPSYGRTQR
jgi:hypothetical protein